MLKIEHPAVFGFEAAIRGMRNPMNSWDKSDSVLCGREDERCSVCEERHTLIGAQMEDVFSRLRRLETNDAAQSAKLDAIDKRVESMDAKLDRIIAKIG